MPQSPLVPDLREARRFLDLFGEGLLHRFQVFPDKKGVPSHAWHEEGDLDDLAPTLSSFNNRDHGVYFTVNETSGGRSKDHVTAIRAFFVDLDKAPLEPVLACGVEPHAIVCSSPGKWHVYWLVSYCPVQRFEPIQLALAEAFGGDKQVADPSRVMRLPGFYNVKDKPVQSILLEVSHHAPYRVDDFVAHLGLNEGAAIERKKLPPLSDLFQQKIQEGDRHKKLMRYAVKFAHEDKTEDEVYALVQGINHVACVKPKPEKEVRDIIQAAFNYAGPPGGGFQPEEHEEDDDDGADMSIPEPFVTGAPGLVGKLAEWVNAGITRNQPHFALAVSLAFVGVLKAHRVQTPRGSRTNHMTLAIGKSGSSKSEAGDRIESLIKHAGFDHFAMGIPASDSALRSALSNRQGRAYLYWDEMGLALEKMLSRNAPFHASAIKDLMVEVWSKSHSILRRKELITQESQKLHVDIEQPCFGMYGTAQPEIFYGALSNAHAADGFYPRLLVFETPKNYPVAREVERIPPPHHLVEFCREIEGWPTGPQGNVGSLIIEPRVVPISPGAQKLFDAAKEDIERKLNRVSDSLTSGVWARSLSHMEKIALTVEDGAVISRDSAEWSIDLVNQLSASMAAAFKLRVSDSPVEKTKNKVLEIIKTAGQKGVSQNILTRKTQFLRDRNERDRVTEELVASGKVVFTDAHTGARPAKRWVAARYAPKAPREEN